MTETLRELLREAIETVHQTGSIRNHSDPNDKTGWHVHGIETCADALCVDGLAALARSESPSPEGLTEAILAWFDEKPTGYQWSTGERLLAEIAYRLSDERAARLRSSADSGTPAP